MFFSIAFFYRFWEGLGGVWGGFWEGFRVLGAPWVVFLRFLLMLTFGMLSGGLLQPPGVDFGSILRALGGFWLPFWLHF